jgi:hypothetical protein
MSSLRASQRYRQKVTESEYIIKHKHGYGAKQAVENQHGGWPENGREFEFFSTTKGFVSFKFLPTFPWQSFQPISRPKAFDSAIW